MSAPVECEHESCHQFAHYKVTGKARTTVSHSACSGHLKSAIDWALKHSSSPPTVPNRVVVERLT